MADTFRFGDLPGWEAAVDVVAARATHRVLPANIWEMAGSVSAPFVVRPLRATPAVVDWSLQLMVALFRQREAFEARRSHLRLVRPGPVYIEIPIGGDDRG